MSEIKKQISLFWPAYNGREIQLAMKTLFPASMENRWLGQAHVVDQFEREFGKKYNYNYCLAVNSGSASLELAYHLVGIKDGDEVISPVLTCTATNIPLLRMGAKIVFADVKNDLTIDPEDVEKKITKKTKAVVAVSLGGLPIDERIFTLGKKHKLPVIIDAAQSLGVSESKGDYVCYSFQAIKLFTTGDGGMLILRNKNEYDRAKKLRWFGIDRDAKIRANWQPYKRRQMTMDIEEPGYKFHMNDIAAMLGLVGLSHADEYLNHRKKIAEIYNQNLKCQTISGGSFWLYGILTNDRDRIAKILDKAGIESNMVHLRNDIFHAFGGKRMKLPNMNKLESQYLYLPINVKMSFDDAKKVARVLNSVLK